MQPGSAERLLSLDPMPYTQPTCGSLVCAEHPVVRSMWQPSCAIVVVGRYLGQNDFKSNKCRTNATKISGLTFLMAQTHGDCHKVLAHCIVTGSRRLSMSSLQCFHLSMSSSTILPCPSGPCRDGRVRCCASGEPDSQTRDLACARYLGKLGSEHGNASPHSS